MTHHGRIWLVFVDGAKDPADARKVRAFSAEQAAEEYLEQYHADHDFVGSLEVEVALASQPDVRTRWTVSAETTWVYSAREGRARR